MIDAITNVTNNELLNFAADTVQKTKSPGTFRFFMKSQFANNIEQSEAPKMDVMLKMLSSFGRPVNIKTDDDEIVVSGEKDKEDSRCCDFNLQELVDGIVGIIEGFGLLDYNTDESVIEEISAQISEIIDISSQDGEKDINSLIENIKTLSDVIARMPNANEFESLKNEATQMIEKLVSEYQCSFDNTNKTGVKDDLAIKVEPEQKPDENKIKLMIKTAMVKAKMQSSKPDKVEFVKQKVMKNENSSEEKTINNGAVAINKNTTGTLKTTETAQKQDVMAEAPTKEESAENVAKIAEKITASRIDGKQEFDVTLKPSSLGKLSIKLTMEGDSIKAQIKASDLFVKGIISEQLPELSQTLKGKGVNMTNIEVVYDSPMFSSTEQQFQGQSQYANHTGQSMRSFVTKDINPEDLAYSATMDNTDLSIMNSSVEFIA